MLVPVVKRAHRLIAWAALSLLTYGAFVIAGAVWRTDGAMIADAEGPRIWVIAGPIHTDIVVPLRYGEHDLSSLVRGPAFSAEPGILSFWREEVSHLAISWGARTFFTEVPTWDRLRPWHVAASIWAESAVHATLVERPWEIVGAVELTLTEPQYDDLIAAFDDTMEGGLATPVPLAGLGYTPSDGFYASDEIYHPFRTCNVWTARVLAEAGVSVGAWTPYPQGLMWSLRQGQTARSEDAVRTEQGSET